MLATGPGLTNKLGVELIHTGSWSISTGTWEATSECLASAVEAQKCPAIRPPVLKLGHRDSRFDGDPALGWVQNLRVTNGGKTLVGDFSGMPAALDQIMANAYPDRSVEGSYNVLCAAGHHHKFVLTAVALLGVTPPGISTLKSFRDVASLYGLAASAPSMTGTPVSVRIRASAPSAPAVAPSVFSAPTRSTTPMTSPVDRIRYHGESVLAWALATGRINAATADRLGADMSAGKYGEPAVEKTVSVMAAGAYQGSAKPRSAVAPAAPTQSQVLASRQAAKGPAYRINPLVEDIFAGRPALYRNSVRAAEMPTLFPSGDLPVYTASGIDPTMLLDVPWSARHAVAAARTQAEAYDLIQSVSGPDGEGMAQVTGLANNSGNREYQMRVDAWTERGYELSREAAERMENEQAAVAASMTKPVHEMTDDEQYELMFGDIDRRAEERLIEAQKAIVDGRSWGHGQDVDKVRASLEERIAASGVRRTPQTTSKSIDYSKVLGGGE